MILTMVALAFLVWVLICWGFMRLILWLLKRKHWLYKDKSYLISRNVVLVLLIGAPFWQDIFIHYYQKLTFPKICQQLAGYHPKEPVKLTSLYSDRVGYKYLLLPHVEFVEWEKKNAREPLDIEVGKYRFSHYPQGANQCAYLRSVRPNLDDSIKFNEDIYIKNNYPLANRTGTCMGIEKVNEFTSRYQFDSGARGIKSDFGYRVSIEYLQLFDRIKNEVAVEYQILRATSSVWVFSLIDANGFLGTVFYKSCDEFRDFIYTDDPARKQQSHLGYRDHKIIKGFLDLD